MKKMFLTIFLFLVLVPNVRALTPNYTIEGLYIEADIQENGDLLVKEQIVLRGAFNGYEREIYYKNNSGTLYDASEVELIRICEYKVQHYGSFDNEQHIDKCFEQTDYALLEDKHVYQQKLLNGGISLKMYMYNISGTRVFYIEYLLKRVVIVHDDIAELYWTFIGSDFDDNIKDVRINVNLPKNSTELRGWAHGPLYGNIDLVSKKGVTATVKNLERNELVDIRMVFDKNIIPYGTKLSHRVSLPEILEIEQGRADDANKVRQKSRIIHYGIISLSGLWLIGLILLFINVYRKYDKEYKSDFNLEYYREFAGDYGPGVVDYLMKRNVTTNALSASILEIVRKKGFIFREDIVKNKKEYVLVDSKGQNIEPLTKEEEHIKKWLLDYGIGTEVSLKDISKSATQSEANAREFLKEFDKWVQMIKIKAEKESFFYDNIDLKFKLGSYAIPGIILIVMTSIYELATFIMPLLIVGVIAWLIYIGSFTKRTKKGNDHFVRWNAFKKFLLDFGRFNEKELPEIVLWEKYLVYATVFGIADKVRKHMEIKMKNMNIKSTNYPTYMYLHTNHVFARSLNNTISNTKRMSHTKIAQSRSSSGGGFGGGFSGGGGFGGGGGGGRGF
jgi:uncharacterized membrane protein